MTAAGYRRLSCLCILRGTTHDEHVEEHSYKMIREVDDIEDARGQRHVLLEVLSMPADATKIAGMVTMQDAEPDHQIGAHRSAVPMEIEVARALAWKIARERGADIIWIFDPKKLYPRENRPVAPN
jgi:hypothetical protein